MKGTKMLLFFYVGEKMPHSAVKMYSSKGMILVCIIYSYFCIC